MGLLWGISKTAFPSPPRILRVLFTAALIGVVMLYLLQNHMIYHPRRYQAQPNLLPGTIRLKYDIEADGTSWRQVSFYVPPKSAPTKAPDRLWVLFGGNASLALEWVDLINQVIDTRAGYLLVEYPGYGFSEGAPSQKSILATSEKALSMLAAHLKVPAATLERHLGIVGYSLGCAAGLQFTVGHPAEKVLLIAPFTSTSDMAKHRVGWPLCLLLREKYDNVACLRQLLSRAKSPAITILHGGRDMIIPAKMSRELARLSSKIDYHEYPHADHLSVMKYGNNLLLNVMKATR